MWKWIRKKREEEPPPPPVLTNEAYERWLQAMRPQPLQWFLNLDESDQTALATLGTEYSQDICLGIGYAVADPDLAEAGLDAADNPESESKLLERLVAGFTEKILDQQQITESLSGSNMASMGGVTQRKKERAKEEQEIKNKGRALMGRIPDEVEL